MLARLDERIARSPVGEVWIDGEIIHLEDRVLHDAGHDIRTPTHELIIARDVLRNRRRIASQPPGWALSPDGLRSLRGQKMSAAVDHVSASDGAAGAEGTETGDRLIGEEEEEEASEQRSSPFDAELAAIDAVLGRSEAAFTEAIVPTRSSAA